jgi:hypothetical protein
MGCKEGTIVLDVGSTEGMVVVGDGIGANGAGGWEIGESRLGDVVADCVGADCESESAMSVSSGVIECEVLWGTKVETEIGILTGIIKGASKTALILEGNCK